MYVYRTKYNITSIPLLLTRDNFKVMFDQTNANMTVFHLLEHSCIELMKHSFIIKGQEGSQLTHHFVYNRMLWSKYNCMKIYMYMYYS